MKKLTILSIALLFATYLNAQWTTINSGTGKNLTSLSFADNSNGAIGGEDGLVLFTSDGGDTWADKSVGGDFPPDILDVCMVNETTAWVVGSSGKIFKTTDAGNTWDEQFWDPTLNPYRLNAVFFIDENKGWATGMSGNVIYTTDGGATPWQEQTTIECFYWNFGLFFLDENNGWVAGQYETIDKTTNGGMNWEGLNAWADPGISIQDIFFVNQNKGWVAGTYGEVWNTTDGGTTWNETQPSQYDLNAVFFVNENQGYTAGQEGRVCLTMNGGQTWLTYWSITTDVSLQDIHFFDESNGIVVGYEGTILKTENNGGLSVNTPDISSQIAISPNPSNGMFTIDVNQKSQFEVVDIQGKIILSRTVSRFDNSIDMTNHSKGVYFVRLIDDEGTKTGKLILE